MFIKFFIAVLLSAALFSSAYAGDFSINGFLQGNYSLNAGSSNPDGGDYKLMEERGQVKAEGRLERLRLFLKTDISYDRIDNRGGVEIREGYADYTGGLLDIRLGRQIVTWGTGDLVFINDVFPKDYEAFFSGGPMEYLKRGVDGVKFGIYPDVASFEAILIPFFEPNNLPDPKRFWMFDPMPAVTNRGGAAPASTFENTELALRAYRGIAGFDGSVYLYKGFYRTPSMLPDSLTAPTRIELFYPELLVYGVSLQGNALGGVISLEGGYYDSVEDRSGEDPFTPNSETKMLLGYQRQFIEDFTAGLQYNAVYMHDYQDYRENLPQGFPQEPRLKQLASLRLTYLMVHQDMKLQWFSFWSPSDKDYFLNPDVRYNFTDHLWAALGLNIFGGGRETTQFGSLDKNDNIYIQVRYEL